MKAISSSIKRITVLLLLILILVVQVIPSSAAPAAQTETFHLHVPAVAEVFGSTCPWNWVPAVDTVCEDWAVLYAVEGEPSELKDQPWVLGVYHWGGIVHPDETVTDLYFYEGYLENPQGSFDMKKYTQAQVSGIVSMSDGSDVAIDLSWDMTLAELHHTGNNGPYNVTRDLDRHYADRCVTINMFAHQQWRGGAPGQVSGSIGGLNIQSLYLLDTEPFIAGRSIFTYINVAHGGCTPP